MTARRILYVVNNPAFFLSHRLPIAAAARNVGLEVHVATPAGPGVSTIINHGFRFHEIHLTRRTAFASDEIASIARLTSLFRSARPDVVHLVTIKPVLYGSIAAQLARIPRVVAAISGLGSVFIAPGKRAFVRRTLVEGAYRVAFRHRDLRVIFQNPEDREYFVRRGLVQQSSAVLIRGSGVDVNEYSPAIPPAGEPVVVLAARLLTDKGVREFAAAANKLHSEGIKARFALVGDIDAGNPSSLARTDVLQFERSGIEVWGHRTDMVNVLRLSSVVCLPSYREGLPKVLIEAAACGRPIVTTDVPGCREVVRNGVNGLLVPPRDSDRLATALKRLVTDESLRSQMGERGREIAVREFSIERVIDETLKLYGASR